jgi:hypothetical protein
VGRSWASSSSSSSVASASGKAAVVLLDQALEAGGHVVASAQGGPAGALALHFTPQRELQSAEALAQGLAQDADLGQVLVGLYVPEPVQRLDRAIEVARILAFRAQALTEPERVLVAFLELTPVLAHFVVGEGAWWTACATASEGRRRAPEVRVATPPAGLTLLAASFAGFTAFAASFASLTLLTAPLAGLASRRLTLLAGRVAPLERRVALLALALLLAPLAPVLEPAVERLHAAHQLLGPVEGLFHALLAREALGGFGGLGHATPQSLEVLFQSPLEDPGQLALALLDHAS